MFRLLNIKRRFIMRIHNPLDKILNNEAKIKILRFLCRTEAEWSGRQIAKEIKLNPVTCHKALLELNNERVLLLRIIGKSYLYSINKKNFIVSDLLKPLYKKESKISENLYKMIVKDTPFLQKNKVISIAVFGSMVKREEKPTSDIDILVLIKNSEDKKEIEKYFERINERIMSKFSKTISAYIQSIDEFKLKYERNLVLIKNILNSHKLLIGKPLKELL